MKIPVLPTPEKISASGRIVVGCDKVIKITDDSLPDEGYELTIKNGITVKAKTPAGFFYAEKTLKQLCALYGDILPECTIYDKPKYSYRGFMIDCSRHFFSVADIKQMIDDCADYKFNKFHWHLSDDPGFRVQIDKYPELTSVGAYRHGNAFGREINDDVYGGYYTKEDIKDIVSYCAERFIEVIPEIDLPGHTSSILASIPGMTCDGHSVEVKKMQGIYSDIICAGKEKNYRIIFDILDEMCEMFTGEYFHIGGDEAPKKYWEKCPDCQKAIKENGLENEEQLQGYFTHRIADYLKSKGKTVIGWNECLNGKKLDDSIVIQYWMDHKNVVKPSNNPVIVSDFFHYYTDYPYSMTPLKKTYDYNEKINSNVIGVETPIWTEFISDLDKMQRMCFPRFIAVAQTGWSEKKPDYKDFENDLVDLLKKLRPEFLCEKRKWNPFFLTRPLKTKLFFYSTLNMQVIRRNRSEK